MDAPIQDSHLSAQSIRLLRGQIVQNVRPLVVSHRLVHLSEVMSRGRWMSLLETVNDRCPTVFITQVE